MDYLQPALLPSERKLFIYELVKIKNKLIAEWGEFYASGDLSLEQRQKITNNFNNLISDIGRLIYQFLVDLGIEPELAPKYSGIDGIINEILYILTQYTYTDEIIVDAQYYKPLIRDGIQLEQICPTQRPFSEWEIPFEFSEILNELLDAWIQLDTVKLNSGLIRLGAQLYHFLSSQQTTSKDIDEDDPIVPDFIEKITKFLKKRMGDLNEKHVRELLYVGLQYPDQAIELLPPTVVQLIGCSYEAA